MFTFNIEKKSREALFLCLPYWGYCSRVAALPLSQSLLRCNRIPRFA